MVLILTKLINRQKCVYIFYIYFSWNIRNSEVILPFQVELLNDKFYRVFSMGYATLYIYVRLSKNQTTSVEVHI